MFNNLFFMLWNSNNTEIPEWSQITHDIVAYTNKGKHLMQTLMQK